MTDVRIGSLRWHLVDETGKRGVTVMSHIDQASELLTQIASEQRVVDRLCQTTEQLRLIQQAKRDLTNLTQEQIRDAFERRHALLGGGERG